MSTSACWGAGKTYPPHGYPCLGCEPCPPNTFCDIVRKSIVAPRVFNDFSNSTLAITDEPTLVVFDEHNFTDDGIPGSFANRHDVLFSNDGGATAYQFTTDIGFTMSAVITLQAGTTSPRKEAGIRFNSNVTGDAQFLINSDAGEIVAFGGGAPFYSFSAGALPDYVPGTPLLMGITYSGDAATPRTIEYFIDRTPETPGGIESSGPLLWENNENGPVDFYAGYYAQISPANANDSLNVRIEGMAFATVQSPVPEPGTLFLSAAGIGCLLGFRRSGRKNGVRPAL